MAHVEKKVIATDQAPKALGPYSAAIQVGAFIFCSGQTGIDPATNQVVEGGVEAEARQVLSNLRAVLEAAGASMANIVKTTVFLRDMNDFAKMNAIYAEFFADKYPARSTFAVAGLPKNASVEIEAIAYIGE